MSKKIKNIVVYASSASRIAPVYFDAAKELGKRLVQHDITCINGAGNKGLMAAVTDSVLAAGGKVIGVIPQFMVDNEWLHPTLSETIITSGMHERKQWMADHSDACIALPGGVGTLEEILEIMAWRQLGLYANPAVLLNINGYYSPLIEMLEQGRAEQFIPEQAFPLWTVATTAQDALDIILNQ